MCEHPSPKISFLPPLCPRVNHFQGVLLGCFLYTHICNAAENQIPAPQHFEMIYDCSNRRHCLKGFYFLDCGICREI